MQVIRKPQWPAILVRHVIHHPALVLPKWNVLDRPWECAVVIATDKGRGQEVKVLLLLLLLLLPRCCLSSPSSCVFQMHTMAAFGRQRRHGAHLHFLRLPLQTGTHTGQRRPRLHCLCLAALPSLKQDEHRHRSSRSFITLPLVSTLPKLSCGPPSSFPSFGRCSSLPFSQQPSPPPFPSPSFIPAPPHLLGPPRPWPGSSTRSSTLLPHHLLPSTPAPPPLLGSAHTSSHALV